MLRSTLFWVFLSSIYSIPPPPPPKKRGHLEMCNCFKLSQVVWIFWMETLHPLKWGHTPVIRTFQIDPKSLSGTERFYVLHPTSTNWPYGSITLGRLARFDQTIDTVTLGAFGWRRHASSDWSRGLRLNFENVILCRPWVQKNEES